MGFVLNYHSFSSVSLGKVVVLNDLFVAESFRKQGIAQQFINRVLKLAKETGSIRVDLSTAKDNFSVQSVYEKIGFTKDNDYFSYTLPVNN